MLYYAAMRYAIAASPPPPAASHGDAGVVSPALRHAYAAAICQQMIAMLPPPRLLLRRLVCQSDQPGIAATRHAFPFIIAPPGLHRMPIPEIAAMLPPFIHDCIAATPLPPELPLPPAMMPRFFMSACRAPLADALTRFADSAYACSATFSVSPAFASAAAADTLIIQTLFARRQASPDFVTRWRRYAAMLMPPYAAYAVPRAFAPLFCRCPYASRFDAASRQRLRRQMLAIRAITAPSPAFFFAFSPALRLLLSLAAFAI